MRKRALSWREGEPLATPDYPTKGHTGCLLLIVFLRRHNRSLPGRRPEGAFTLSELLVSIVLVGIGLSTTIGSLTKLNSFASGARNATGAYTAAMDEIDKFQSLGPFNPQKNNDDDTPQIPPEMATGTRYVLNVPIYTEPDTGAVVAGTMKIEITDANVPGVVLYREVVKVTYPNTPGAKQYSLTMTTLRASDS